jgi:hypothetical protein
MARTAKAAIIAANASSANSRLVTKDLRRDSGGGGTTSGAKPAPPNGKRLS